MVNLKFPAAFTTCHPARSTAYAEIFFNSIHSRAPAFTAVSPAAAGDPIQAISLRITERGGIPAELTNEHVGNGVDDEEDGIMGGCGGISDDESETEEGSDEADFEDPNEVDDG